MFAQVLIAAFVLCLGLTVLAVLVSRQLLSTYTSELLRHYFYYLAAFHAFAFYSLWGLIVTRGLLASLETDAAAIEVVAGFLPVLGVPFLFVSWVMLMNMACSMFGARFQPAWHSLHAAVLALLLLASWLAVRWLQSDVGSPADLPLIEAAAIVVLELTYFGAFLVLVLRFGAAADGDKSRILRTFALLMCAGVASRTLLAGLVLVDVRLSPISLLVLYASNLPALLYLRANADRVFAPVKAESVTKVGMDHVFERYGVTKRERQIVQKICLGKTNKQIAEELFISLQTVKDHTHRIYSKIGVSSRMQLVQMMSAAK